MSNPLSEEWVTRLREEAFSVMQLAYAPYSRYPVGAALLTNSGEIFRGCNIENAAYPSGLCAEASAIAQMVSSQGIHLVRAVLVVCAGDDPAWPCGMCRQRLNEFADPEMEVIVANREGKLERMLFRELFPHSFGPSNLRGFGDGM